MRIPGGALLITLGMLFLWVAITGRLERFATGWNYVRGGTDELPESEGNEKPISNQLNGVVDRPTWHVNQLTHGLDPIVSLTMPGGVG